MVWGEARPFFQVLGGRAIHMQSGMILAAWLSLIAIPEALSRPHECDTAPTGVQIVDYDLEFKVPNGLMPDPQFDRRRAKLRVHRVKPLYANGRCGGAPRQAIVLIHGRSIPGSVAFDLRHPTTQDPAGGGLSLQEALARAGIDTFAPDLLGYGLSTRFENGLDDPYNASLPPYDANGACAFAEGCDRSRNTAVFPLDQQRRYLGDGINPVIDGLGVNPLGGLRFEHSSHTYFASPDVWARDVMQVIDSAIEKAEPDGGNVVLLGYSFGGPTVARTLYLLGKHAHRKVKSVVFLASLFNRLPGVPVEVNLPTEEEDLTAFERSTSFPLAVIRLGGWTTVPALREPVCTGRVVANAPEEQHQQLKDLDPLGASWGGSNPNAPTGVVRAPTFTLYGWNRDVAATFTLPTLVLHAADDQASPVLNSDNIFNALTAVSNKVLVQVGCASHTMQFEGCSGLRCDDGNSSTIPYGQSSQVWAGPHSTVAATVAEWVKDSTFDGSGCGHFIVNDSGVVNEVATPNCPGTP